MLEVRLEGHQVLSNEDKIAAINKTEIENSFIGNDKKDNQKAGDE